MLLTRKTRHGLVLRLAAPVGLAEFLRPVCASAQTITTAPTALVPVAAPWVLVLLGLMLLAGGFWRLRRRGDRRQSLPALLLAALVAAGLWSSASLWAQLSLQFTNPAGETLAIPVTPIVVAGVLQGFQVVDYQNTSGATLRVTAINPPDFAECFPGGLDAPLSPPGSGGGSACTVGTVLASGDSCREDVDAVCRASEASAAALIHVAPTTLVFVVGGTASVTVSTDASSPIFAANITATIPGASSLSVSGSTCGASLAPGDSCQITFTSATPTSANVSIAGDNAASQTAAVSAVPAPVIAISGPAQPSRVIAVSGAALALTITNDAGSVVNADAITVTDKSAVPGLAVDDSDCTSVAPGASCTLSLTSAAPYAPGVITIGGSNTANSPTTLVAFSYLGGLVFEESGGSGKTAADATQEFSSQWTSTLSDIAGATSLNDGIANTDSIVADVACAADSANCAAQRCRNIGAEWYLPSRDELTAMVSALCSNGAIPCNAGGFSAAQYRSSSQIDPLTAWATFFPNGLQAILSKNLMLPVRCVRSF